MIKVVGDFDSMIKNIKNKWDRTGIQQLMRNGRYFVKRSAVRRMKRSKSLFLQRKWSAEEKL